MADQENTPAPALIVLRYIGQSGAYFTGYPACDLTEADIAASGHSIDDLLKLSIFERVGTPPAGPEPVVNTPPAALDWGNSNEVSNG